MTVKKCCKALKWVNDFYICQLRKEVNLGSTNGIALLFIKYKCPSPTKHWNFNWIFKK